MPNVVIIGNGPAGLSAAIYAARAGMETLVIGSGNSSLLKAEKIENFFGHAEPITGKELLMNGEAQCKKLGVVIVEDEAVGISFEEKLMVRTASGQSFPAEAIVLATGMTRKIPKIQGLEKFEGSGVSYCATCDGFFFRGKDVAVLGSGEYAANEAMELMPIAKSVTILTNGEELKPALPNGVGLNKGKIKTFAGESTLEKVEFEDGSHLDAAGVFIAMGTAGSADFAKKLGAETEGNKIIVDEKMATNVPGIFAAGDGTGGWYQVAKAVYQGAVAGSEAAKFLRGSNQE
jgi:thioredoxin reductase (NADPH)